ncbi:MAG: hypothetical protein ACRDKG_13845 [Actinomycetota bacterium]
MKSNEEMGNLKLIVRALHQDVSDMDHRLQVLEQEIRRLQEMLERSPDLVVMRRRQRGA